MTADRLWWLAWLVQGIGIGCLAVLVWGDPHRPGLLAAIALSTVVMRIALELARRRLVGRRGR